MKKNYLFSFIKKTGNAKLGADMSSTYSSSNTCPNACPFKNNGCYCSEGYYTRLHWQKVDTGERGVNFNDLINKIKSLKPGSKLRLNIGGDLVGHNNNIYKSYLDKYIEACKPLKAWTYTHYPISKGNNLQLIKQANKKGLSINVSCETEYQAIQSVDNGLLTALVVKSTEDRKSYKLKDIHGNTKATVLICPQQTNKDNITCSNCMLCHDRPKNIVIGFKAHNATQKVNKILENIK